MRILTCLAVAAFVFAMGSAVSMRRPQSYAEPPSAPPTNPFPRAIAATGTFEPSSENIILSPHHEGNVETIYVKPGDHLRAGDPILKLNTQILEKVRDENTAALGVTEASIREAQHMLARRFAELYEARIQFRNAEQMALAKALSEEDLLRRKTAFAVAEAEQARAQAILDHAHANRGANQSALESTRSRLAQAILRAPAPGTVLRLNVHPGEHITPTDSSPRIILGQITPLHLRVDIDEAEIAHIHSGMSGIVMLRGNTAVKSPLRFIRFEPSVVPKLSLSGLSTERVDTRVLQAIFEVEEANPFFFVGQQADVSLRLER